MRVSFAGPGKPHSPVDQRDAMAVRLSLEPAASASASAATTAAAVAAATGPYDAAMGPASADAAVAAATGLSGDGISASATAVAAATAATAERAESPERISSNGVFASADGRGKCVQSGGRASENEEQSGPDCGGGKTKAYSM